MTTVAHRHTTVAHRHLIVTVGGHAPARVYGSTVTHRHNLPQLRGHAHPPARACARGDSLAGAMGTVVTVCDGE